MWRASLASYAYRNFPRTMSGRFSRIFETRAIPVCVADLACIITTEVKRGYISEEPNQG